MHPQTLVVYAQDGHYLNAAWGAPARNGGYWSGRGYEWYGGV